MDINIIDYEGKEQSGNWNGKTYSSKVAERPELARVYLDNMEVHVDKDMLEKASGIGKHVTDYAAAMRKIADINLYSDMEKLLMLSEILQDNDFCRYMVSHANPPKSYLEFIINGKPLRFQTVDQMAELTDSGTVKNIIDELYTGSSDETIKRFKEIRPKKIEE